MKQFEYMNMLRVFDNVAIDYINLQKDLNQYGFDGWELVTSTIVRNQSSYTEPIILFTLKREIKE